MPEGMLIASWGLGGVSDPTSAGRVAEVRASLVTHSYLKAEQGYNKLTLNSTNLLFISE